MNKFLSLAALALLVSAATVLGANPSFQSFNPNQFGVNGTTISVKNGPVFTNVTIQLSTTTKAFSADSITLAGTTVSNFNQIAGSGVTNSFSLNPTDNVVPYRVDSHTMGDSPMLVNPGDGSVAFQGTPGATNSMGRLQITNQLQMLNVTGGQPAVFDADGNLTNGVAGSSGPWTNSAGTIMPAGGQAATNTLQFVSGLSDASTNMAMAVDTAVQWTWGSLLTFYNGGSFQGFINPWGVPEIGKSLGPFWGSSQNDFYGAVGDMSVGDPLDRYFFLGNYVDNTYTNGWVQKLETYRATGEYAERIDGGTPFNDTYEMKRDSIGGEISYTFNSVLAMGLFPNRANTVPAYVLGTSQIHVSGDLLELSNSGTNQFTISFDGALTSGTPNGGTAAPWKFGSYESTPATVQLDVSNTLVHLLTDASTAAIQAGQTNVARANPTASIGLTAVNGSAATFTSSDSAPALDVSIAPTWTGLHTYSKNVLASVGTGPTNYFDLNFATQTNQVTAALAFSYLTNGVDNAQGTVLRGFFNGSGSDQTVTWPAWSTNMGFALPPAFTNQTATWVLMLVLGDTSNAAKQTNAHVLSVSYTR